MRSFSAASAATTHIIRLDPGEDVLGTLHEYIKTSEIHTGAVVSGIGTLDRCRMHLVTTTDYPPQEIFPIWDGVPLELVAMQGVIADGEPHIHITVASPDGAFGGHLEPGCRVLYLSEIVVLEFVTHALTRSPDSHGVPHLEATRPH
jgi:uncharacterized protein